jgi:hypothetical protein
MAQSTTVHFGKHSHFVPLEVIEPCVVEQGGVSFELAVGMAQVAAADSLQAGRTRSSHRPRPLLAGGQRTDRAGATHRTDALRRLGDARPSALQEGDF